MEKKLEMLDFCIRQEDDVVYQVMGLDEEKGLAKIMAIGGIQVFLDPFDELLPLTREEAIERFERHKVEKVLHGIKSDLERAVSSAMEIREYVDDGMTAEYDRMMSDIENAHSYYARLSLKQE